MSDSFVAVPPRSPVVTLPLDLASYLTEDRKSLHYIVRCGRLHELHFTSITRQQQRRRTPCSRPPQAASARRSAAAAQRQ